MITGQQKEFIEVIAASILDYAPQYNVHVISPIIAQAIIESNWGNSGLAQKARNLFGIKCGSSWKGASINMKTKEEYQPGTLTSISANFRSYKTFEESIHDYFEFTNTKRYAALKNCTTPEQYCNAIKDAGYATSSTYVSTLMNCINTYRLDEYDNCLEPYEKKVKRITAVISYERVVDDVIKGVYGNGDDRVARLAQNGYNALAVQYMVNQQLKINDLTDKVEKLYNMINNLKEVLHNEV